MPVPARRPRVGLDGRTALVTGGAKRIGAAITRTLADAGCRVAVHANTALADAAALAKTVGGVVVQADLSDPAAAEAVVGEAAASLGAPVDFVVNNASAFPAVGLEAATYGDLDAMMRLHAWAPLATARALARTGGSAVVNLLDTRITSHDPLHFPYLLSKQALWHLTASLARELAPLRVNAVAPGPILPATSGDAGMEAAIKATVLGREGRPDEVAHAVRFVLEAEYVTGQTVFVDGGRHLRA